MKRVRRRAAGPLAAERIVAGRGSKAWRWRCSARPRRRIGDDVRDEQEVLGQIADVVIEAYAVESAAARAEKLRATRGADAADPALDSVRVYVTDAADRVVHSPGKSRGRLAPNEAGRCGR